MHGNTEPKSNSESSTAKNKKPVNPLGEKQTYRQLSRYKKVAPPKAKKLSKVKRAQRKQIKALLKKIKADPSRMSLRNSLARALHKTKLYQLMVDELMPYNDKLDKTTKLLLADALGERHMHNEQLKILLDLATQQPKNSRIQFKLGLAYYSLRQADSSVESLRKAISLRPSFWPPYNTLLELFKETENTYESRELLKNIINQFGAKSKFLAELCELNFKDEFIDQGIDVCMMAYSSNSKNAESLIYLGLLQLKAQQTNDGQTNIIKAANKFASNEFAQWAAGDIYLQKKNFHVALRYFKSAVLANKNSARSHLGLALTQFELGKYKAALSEFKTACKLDQGLAKDPFRIAANRLARTRNFDWMKTYDGEAKRCRFTDLIKMD